MATEEPHHGPGRWDLIIAALFLVWGGWKLINWENQGTWGHISGVGFVAMGIFAYVAAGAHAWRRRHHAPTPSSRETHKDEG